MSTSPEPFPHWSAADSPVQNWGGNSTRWFLPQWSAAKSERWSAKKFNVLMPFPHWSAADSQLQRWGGQFNVLILCAIKRSQIGTLKCKKNSTFWCLAQWRARNRNVEIKKKKKYYIYFFSWFQRSDFIPVVGVRIGTLKYMTIFELLISPLLLANRIGTLKCMMVFELLMSSLLWANGIGMLKCRTVFELLMLSLLLREQDWNNEFHCDFYSVCQ